MQYGFGIDVGGTTCKMGLFDSEGILVEKWENQECLDMHMHGEAMKTVVEIKKKYDAVTTATKYEIK